MPQSDVHIIQAGPNQPSRHRDIGVSPVAPLVFELVRAATVVFSSSIATRAVAPRAWQAFLHALIDERAGLVRKIEVGSL